ncbi:unnamed protein product [Caenorhabditis nigoni]
MNPLLLLLFFLFGGIWCDHPLNSEENQYWKANCGTKPYHPRRFGRRRIVGGKPIQGNEAPWAVSIQSKAGECSATIISPRHILTASHCLMKDMTEYDYVRHQTNKKCFGNDWIFYPDLPWFSIKNSYGKFFSNKLSRVIMMNYCVQLNSLYDDMMILELRENIQIDDYAFPACVSNNPNSQAINTEVTVTSYGHDNWDVNNTDSSGTDMLRSGVFQVIGYYNEGRSIWINGEPRRVHARPGDSGGSVIHYDNGRYSVIGVNSVIATPGFDVGVSSVYAHYNQICRYTGIC